MNREEFVRAATEVLVDSGQRALLLNPDNTRKGWTHVHHALASGEAFAICARDGVLPVESDCPEEELWADGIAAVLRGVGCTYVKVASGGGPGRVHYWFVGPPGWTTGELALLAKAQPGLPRDLKVRVTDAGKALEMRPPCSPHREGRAPGDLIDPGSPEAALRALKGVMVPLSAETLSLLREGDPGGRFRRLGVPSRTTLVQSLAARYLNARLPFERLFDDLIDPKSVAGVKVREQGTRGRRWLWALWEEQRQWVRKTPPDAGSAEALRMVIRTVRNRPWTGRTAMSDSRVYRALVDRAVIYGFRAPVIAIDQRSLALACGLKPSTVASAIRRLIGMKLLSIDRAAGKRQATTYRLHPDLDVQGVNDSPAGGAKDCIDALDDHICLSVHDLFRTRAGNPPGSLETFLALSGSWSTVAEIRERRIGTSTPRTIRSHLLILESEGLAERNSLRGHRWCLRPDAFERLDSLAEWRGSAGASERQRLEFEEQRLAYDLGYAGATGRTRLDADRVAS